MRPHRAVYYPEQSQRTAHKPSLIFEFEGDNLTGSDNMAVNADQADNQSAAFDVGHMSERVRNKI